MPSELRSETSRINDAKSRGPKTPTTRRPWWTVEMDNQTPAFEKRCETFDEDMRGAAAFSAIVDNSKGYVTALRTDVHLTRLYRKAVDDLRRLRSGKLLSEDRIFQNEPESSDLSPLTTTEAEPEISTEPKEPKESRA